MQAILPRFFKVGTMPTKCSICVHPERAAIDAALVSGVPLRTLETRHAGTKRSALDRHRKHIPAALVQAKQAAEVADATTLLSRVERLTSRCEALFENAEGRGKWIAAATAAREVRGCLELLGKLSGELQTGGTRVAINLTQIESLNIAALAPEQVGAIYDRIESERIRAVERLTDAELEAELARMLPSAVPLNYKRSAYLFDETTLPQPANLETCERSHEDADKRRAERGERAEGWHPWRNASIPERLELLRAAWKRLTGEELALPIRAVGGRARISVEFDLDDDREGWWETWPTVRLLADSVPNTPENAVPQVIDPASLG